MTNGLTTKEHKMDTKIGASRVQNRARLFSLGQIVTTPGAMDALLINCQPPSEFLVRHALGDWGSVCAEDRQVNDEAVKGGDQILSAYKLSDGTKVWVITEGDRSVTTILRPEEY
jgi:hypothetical protein